MILLNRLEDFKLIGLRMEGKAAEFIRMFFSYLPSVDAGSLKWTKGGISHDINRNPVDTGISVFAVEPKYMEKRRS